MTFRRKQYGRNQLRFGNFQIEKNAVVFEIFNIIIKEHL